jgi:aminocarboxymuconate-semialdehyde decarboxylase
MPSETALAISCVIMGGIIENFPRLKFCFAHGGGSYPQIAGRIAHGFKVRPDLCATDTKINPREFNGRFWTDSLVHDTSALSQLMSTVGEVALHNLTCNDSAILLRIVFVWAQTIHFLWANWSQEK